MASPSTLNLTALTTAAGLSVFECWALQPGFVSSSQPGTAGAISLQLGDLANASYSIIPAGFDAGRHNAPNVQYVVYLSGLAHITLPNSSAEAWVTGGSTGALLIAADTAALSAYGHITTYPSAAQTVALQIPTMGGVVPNHTLLHAGPCDEAEQAQAGKRGVWLD